MHYKLALLRRARHLNFLLEVAKAWFGYTQALGLWIDELIEFGHGSVAAVKAVVMGLERSPGTSV